jgi:hypothetical protein
VQPPTPATQAEIELDTRYLNIPTYLIILQLCTFTRFIRYIVLADHQFPDEPDGRILLIGSRNRIVVEL